MPQNGPQGFITALKRLALAGAAPEPTSAQTPGSEQAPAVPRAGYAPPPHQAWRPTELINRTHHRPPSPHAPKSRLIADPAARRVDPPPARIQTHLLTGSGEPLPTGHQSLRLAPELGAHPQNLTATARDSSGAQL